MKSPIELIKEYQCSAKCNNGLFMKWIRLAIEENPDCIVWQRVNQIIEQQSGDEYLSRIWILREYGIIDFEDMFDDAVFWYEKYKVVAYAGR